MTKETLYNQYGATNIAGQDICDDFRRIVQKFIDPHLDRHPIHELECQLIGELTCIFSEARLTRAFAMKRKERDVNKEAN